MLVYELIPQIDYENTRDFSFNRRLFQDCVLRYLDLSLSKVTRRGNCREVGRVSTSKAEKLNFQGSLTLNKNCVYLFCGNTKHLTENKHVCPLESSLVFVRAWKILFRFNICTKQNCSSFCSKQCQIISQLHFAGNRWYLRFTCH